MQIWPWIGQDRAGFYSETQLENLVGSEMRNADQILREWQERQAGDMVWMTPKRKSNGAGRVEIALLEPNRAMILVPARKSLRQPGPVVSPTVRGVFILEPINEHSTRLIMRGCGECSARLRDPVIGYAFWDPLHAHCRRSLRT